jgi:endoglucanase
MMTMSLSAQFVTKNGQLHVDDTQLMNQNGEPIVLRGVSFGWHSLWPRFYTEGSVKWLKDDWKCTIIRAAMGAELGGISYIKRPEYSIKKIETVVDAAIKNDIYVIIDWHSHNIRLEEAKEFFNKMSKKYGEYPNVIYEIFNEPDYETWEEVKAYSEDVISVIRKNDPDNIILVGSPHWSQDLDLAAADPITGYDNLMYTMHFYAATHTKLLRDRVDAAMADGLPVFVSECAGMEASGDGPLNYDEWQAYIDWMEQHKISWITWAISDKLETCSMLYPCAADDGGWDPEVDLNEAGVKTREYVRKLNGN